MEIQYLKSGKDIFLLYLGRHNYFFLKLINPAPPEASIKENCNSRCIACDAWKNKIQQSSTIKELKNFLSTKRSRNKNTIARISRSTIREIIYD